jgi:hypothetical protein
MREDKTNRVPPIQLISMAVQVEFNTYPFGVMRYYSFLVCFTLLEENGKKREGVGTLGCLTNGGE